MILHYCPYGYLVELFPLDGESTVWNNMHLDLSPIKTAKPCPVFGHDCPVYYTAEQFTANGRREQPWLQKEKKKR